MRILLPIFIFIFSVALAQLCIAADVPQSREQISLTFAPVAKKVMPAVVNIYTRHIEKNRASSPFMNDPLFSQVFGAQGFGGIPQERVVNSLGSGVIVGSDGTIITSYHVVKGSDEIKVALSDRREFTGHVQKIDEHADLAVVKIDTKNAVLPVLALRDSDTLEVGDLVLAVGNPFGVGETVTSGIISALARSASDISDYQFFIQTDAAINPGNSGGALVDMQGRLIGINTAIYTHSGGYQGIGFAIPANMVNAVLTGKTGKNGALLRPWLGIAGEPVTREMADAVGMEISRGILVQRVAAGSPAEIAGIRAGDIMLKFAGGEVNDIQSLNFHIATTGIGKSANVTLWRKGKEIVLPVTLTTPPERAEGTIVKLTGNNPLSGATVATLTPDVAEDLHLKAGAQGVVVISGVEDSAFGLTIIPGDVILAVNNQPVPAIEVLQKLLSNPKREFQITLLRGGSMLTFSVMQ